MRIVATFYVDLALAAGVTALFARVSDWLGRLFRHDDGGSGGDWRWRRSRPEPPRGDRDRDRAPRLPDGPSARRARVPR